MTSIRLPIEIDPDLFYPVRLIWANGRIREMKGEHASMPCYLLGEDNPERHRYVSSRRVVNEGKQLFIAQSERH